MHYPDDRMYLLTDIKYDLQRAIQLQKPAGLERFQILLQKDEELRQLVDQYKETVEQQRLLKKGLKP